MEQQELRLHGKPNCTIYDLIGKGDKEVHKTTALGVLFSLSDTAVKCFLKLLGKKVKLPEIEHLTWVVDCEEHLQLDEVKQGRMDVVLRIKDSQGNPKVAIIIEAKDTDAKGNGANEQVRKYAVALKDDLDKFESYVLVALTANEIIDSEVVSITWDKLINAFIKEAKNDFINSFINYILMNMNSYTHEIMVIPAGNTAGIVKTSKIYECESKGSNFAARAKERPIFVAFQDRGGKGFDTLYKLDAIEIAKIDDPSAIAAIDEAHEGCGFGKRVEAYLKEVPAVGEKAIFFLGEETKLPHPACKFGLQNHSYTTIHDVLGEPDPADGVVHLENR